MLIDLGEARAPAEAAEGRPLIGRPGWRWFVALAATAGVLATGVPEPVRGHLVEATVAAGDYAFSGPDGVYLADGDTLLKYGLPPTRPRWRVSGPDLPALGGFLVGETVLITGHGPVSQTAALDARTGAVRWRRAGTPTFIGGDEVLMTHERSGAATVRYEVVDVATGAVRWSLADPHRDPVFYDRDAFVRWSPSGRVEVRDLGTGRVLATGVVPPPDAGTGGWGVQVVGRLMLVPRERGGRAVADAYDLERLVRRWTADLDLASEIVSGCGDALCVSRAAGAIGVRVLESGTGRVRWSDDRRGALERVGPVMLSYGFPEQPPRVQILDAANGHLLADLGQWDIGWPIGDDGLAMAIRPAPDGGAWIAELDLIRAEVRLLGVTRDAFACQTGWTVVACQRPDGTTAIWYPRHRRHE
jgi:outer membrane protein assembly factor BamB